MRPVSGLLTSLATLALIAAACAGQQKTDGSSTGTSTAQTGANGKQATSTIEELPGEEGPSAGATTSNLVTVNAAEGFNVKMPGQPPPPQRQTQNVPKVGDVSVTAYSLQSAEGGIYVASATDYPEKFVASRSDATLLKDTQTGLLGQLKGEVRDEKDITLTVGTMQYPGKAYTISSPTAGEAHVRDYVVGPRVYTLLVLFNPSVGAPAAAEEFLNSLEPINPPPPVDRTAASASDGGTDGGLMDTGAPELGSTPDSGTPDSGAPTRRRRK